MRALLKVFGAFLLVVYSTSAYAFVVDVGSCQTSVFPTATDIVYEYHFDQFALTPDVTVKVSHTSYDDDITIAITDDPSKANLILADDLDQAHMSICRSLTANLFKTQDVTTVKVQSFAIAPDIRVGTTTNTLGAEYIMFNASEEFSDEEAAAFFAVLWKREREQEQATVTAYQLQFRRNGVWVGGPLYRTAWECSDAQWAPGVIGARCNEVLVPK